MFMNFKHWKRPLIITFVLSCLVGGGVHLSDFIYDLYSTKESCFKVETQSDFDSTCDARKLEKMKESILVEWEALQNSDKERNYDQKIDYVAKYASKDEALSPFKMLEKVCKYKMPVVSISDYDPKCSEAVVIPRKIQ